MRFLALPYCALLLGVGIIAAAPAHAADEEIQIKYFELTEGRVVFSYGPAQPGGKVDGERDIYVADFKTLGVDKIVSTKGSDDSPVWSPDGRKIVFASNVTGNYDIYSTNEDGSDLMQLTTDPADDMNPAWSPDGNEIVFDSARGGKGTAVFVMSATGSSVRRITENDGKKATMPRISPRGDEIVFQTNADWPGWDLAVIKPATKELKVLTHGITSYVKPTWYPDGGSFTFSNGSGDELDIYTIQRGSQNAVQLVKRDGRDLDPVWDNDGKLLFFAGEKTPGAGDFQIFVLDRKTKDAAGNTAKGPIQLLEAPGSARQPNFTALPSLKVLARELQKKSQLPTAE